jgi:2-oxoisovalerate dehydrogenase E1 component
MMTTSDVELYRPELTTALTIRATEERLLGLFAEGRLFGTVHTCIGQELVGVSVARALRDDDYVFSSHRCHGHFIAYCDNVEGLVAEIMGKATGVCGGLGGSQHLHQRRFFSNGIEGGIVPVAAGLAMAQSLRTGDGIAVVYLGDGTLGEGVVYEAANIAARWGLPLLFVLENNGIAQSTPQDQTLAGSIEARFAAFGIPTRLSNTWDWSELFASMATSVALVRASGGPVFHQVDTYRLMAHSKGDDTRPADVVAGYRARDPLHQLLTETEAPVWIRDTMAAAEARVARAVARATASDFGTPPGPGDPPAPVRWGVPTFETGKVISGIRDALAEALTQDDRVILIGEDIESPYGGAFKATAGLSAAFPGRVRNTPISEAAITGLANGLALAGYQPVVEIMFGDFCTLAFDQWVNHAAKFAAMYNGQVQVPVIIRTPMGGRRGYGPTHSQSLEKHFLGVPGTQVLCLHHRYDPRALYRSLFATIDRPTLVVENKTLYTANVAVTPPPGYDFHVSDDRFPMARLTPRTGADVTMVAVGGAAWECELALAVLFGRHEIAAELFLPTRLYPFDLSHMQESLRTTRRLVVVEEGQGFASFSSEVLAQAMEDPTLPGLAAARVVAWPGAIPAARPLEDACLPGVDAIVAAVVELCRG